MSNGLPPSYQHDPRGYAIYVAMRENASRSLQLQGEYGKWLIASITILHAGALVALANSERLAPALGGGAGWWFIAGLVLALVCGFVVWINWGLVSRSFEHFARSDLILNDYTVLHEPDPYRIWIGVTYWLPIFLGISSVSMLVAGAGAVSCHVGSEGGPVVRVFVGSR